jgi:Uma2 family endonuclease
LGETAPACGLSVTRIERDGTRMRRDYLPDKSCAEHIMAMPALDTHRWTAAEVRKLTADNPLLTPRYELVDGEVLVTSSPSAPHQRTVKMLLLALDGYLRSTRMGEVYVSPSDVELEPEFLSQPDVFVVAREEAERLRRADFPVHALVLAIEVISPSSGRHDRVRKRPKYQKHVAGVLDRRSGCPPHRAVAHWRRTSGDLRDAVRMASGRGHSAIRARRRAALRRRLSRRAGVDGRHPVHR